MSNLNFEGKKLLIIGSGIWQLPFFEKAKDMGLKIITVDNTPAAPGRVFADDFLQVDLRDSNPILEFAARYKIDGAITGVDIAVPTLARLTHALKLVGPSEQSAQKLTNKALMRSHCLKLGIPCPNFVVANSIEQALLGIKRIGLPFVVKPTDSFGSRGVSVHKDDISPNHLKECLFDAFKFSFTKEILIEEFMTGSESSVEGFVDSSGELQILGISDKKKSNLPYRFDLELHYPANFDTPVLLELAETARKLQKGFGLTSGFLHAELIVTKEGVKVIEVAGRACGAFVVSKLLPAITGQDLVQLYIQQALGQNVTLKLGQSDFGLLRFIVLPQGKVLSISGLDSVKKCAGIIDAGLSIEVQHVVSSPRDTTGRAGYILCRGKSRADTSLLADKALKNLRIEMDENFNER